MTTATLFLPDEATRSLRGWAGIVAQHTFDAIRRAIEVQRGLARVRELDDHLLRDIGLTRAGAERAVRYGRV